EEGDQIQGVAQPPRNVVERRGAAVAKRGRLVLRQLGELGLELQVGPAGPIDEGDHRLRRQRLQLTRQVARVVAERAAAVDVREWTTWASAPSRSSAIGAMPTFVFPYSPPPVLVSAVKSDVFPLPDGPTMPTSSATATKLPLELLLQRDQCPVLQRLDRALGL